ncbi:MAG: Ribosomal RNA small subunit methyltransferase B (EC [uncultured Thiotrichaceae bacterium]|uniref:16S rRNA (cytosine(967)-C(5))-methyltransferase n=1 Tax=uncultured Thiotrichaceae bacterium TaxID=298394 RepID=A0A6S6TA90_9GAMM|nr:MAG: Ribosomal RNA small subunit methyltransferase B (EC [uncultured Thiotrichaceae bacterium]
MNSRVVAAKVLLKVVYQGESLTDVLQHATVQTLSPRDQAWVRNVCFGSIRWHGRLGAVLRQLLAKPMKKADKDIECLLRIGLYQLIYQRTPDHAAVNETVAAARKLKKVWASRLINAVLRGFLRRKEAVLEEIDQFETARYSFPPWLSDRLKLAWPDHWQSILEASNTQAPMVLRVNQRLHSRDEYLAILQKADLSAAAVEHTDNGIVLEQAVPVYDLPGFAAGAVSVQDSAAQLAAELLPCEPGQRVLDACAAPGGKACHLLEKYNDLDLVALDSSERRLEQVTENLERLKLSAAIVTGDAAQPEKWWDGQLFDCILLDAPCSATGVIRRHPDIKLLRKDRDIANLQQEQSAILKAAWAMLKPGGLLLYATCSVLPEENELQIKAFLQDTESAVLEILSQKGSQRLSVVGQQILPGDAGMDGFYYALLRKITQD